MKRDKESAEVVARLDFLNNTAYISVAAWPKWATKMEKRYGKPKFCWRDKEGDVVTAFWEVPIKCVSFRKLKSASSGGKKRGNPNIGKMRRKKRPAL